MSDHEFSVSELRQKRGESQVQPNGRPEEGRHDAGQPHWDPSQEWTYRRRPRPAYIDAEDPLDRPISIPFDPVRLFEALKDRWKWWGAAGLCILVGGLLWTFLSTRSSVSVQLMRRDVPVLFRASEMGDVFRPQELSQETLLGLMNSPEVLARVAAKSGSPAAGARIAAGLQIIPEAREGNLVTVTLTGNRSPQEAVDLLNLYATEFVGYTREIQTREANEISRYLRERLSLVQTELATVTAELNQIPPENRFSNPDRQTEALMVQLSDLEVKHETAKIDLETQEFQLSLRNPVAERLQAAREELAMLELQFTDLHPSVERQKALIERLERQAVENPAGMGPVPRGGNTAVAGQADLAALQSQKQALSRYVEHYGEARNRLLARLQTLGENSAEYAMLRSRFQSLDLLRTLLSSRLRESEMFMDNALGYFHVFSPATLDRVSMKSHWNKRLTLTIAAALFAMMGVAGLILFVEVLDDRLKTVADVERATDLPLLATLGDLDKMTEKEQNAWAFRTWTILKGKLRESQSQGSVCGFISARHGEGRSTWIRLLIKTANERGLRVLTIATRHTEEATVHPHEPTKETENVASTTLSPNVFSFPAQVAQKLNEPNSHSVVHIPIPGWVWNLERREQWQVALNHWRRIDNLVLLVELPPVTEPEAVLLAEKIPQLIWLTDSGKTTFKETRMHLETLRHAGCNLVGAVLNREPVSFLRNQFSRWFRTNTLLFLLGMLPLAAMAQENSVEAAENAGAAPAEDAARPGAPRLSFSASDPAHRGDWQKRLTLGPGDVINLGFFGQTNLNKAGIAVGPDGRISYLQAQDVTAAGLTVDELRERLDEELSKFYVRPRVIVTPVAYNSKRYYVLGRVINRGVFSLDRPMTVIEALAVAQGVETGLLNRNSVDLADLQRSFLIRRGERIPIDFERLFNHGDLSQNILIEPEDFLYFPSANLQEVYVLGEVRAPGVRAHSGTTSVIAALTDRGGFTERAYKRHVLVIRGSINKPEAFVVDLVAIFEGREPDFQLEPRDIVYVSHRPFIRAEELLELATRAFLQSATTAWAGSYITPIIRAPFLPQP